MLSKFDLLNAKHNMPDVQDHRATSAVFKYTGASNSGPVGAAADQFMQRSNPAKYQGDSLIQSYFQAFFMLNGKTLFFFFGDFLDFGMFLGF
jgi:hypothetical protein